MRPVREITAKEENFRTEELIPGNNRFLISKRDSIEPEPVGTIVLMAFKITGYSPDCDGSMLGEFEHIDKNGEPTGWCPHSIGLYSDTDLVVDSEEWTNMFNKETK